MDEKLKEKILNETEGKMKGALETLSNNLSTIRSGRATANMLDPIIVKSKNGKVMGKIKDLATVTTLDPQTISVTAWDADNVDIIDKALRTSNFNFNPIVIKPLIKVPVPFMSGERRQELAKQAKKYTEDCKVALRNVRKKCQDDFKALQKQNKITEDMLKSIMDKQVQKLMDKMHDEAEKKLEDKKKEILY